MSALRPPVAKTAQHPPRKHSRGNQTQPKNGRSARLPLRVFQLSQRTHAEQLLQGVVAYDGSGVAAYCLELFFALGGKTDCGLAHDDGRHTPWRPA